MEVSNCETRFWRGWLRTSLFVKMTYSLASSLDAAPLMPYALYASYKKSSMASTRHCAWPLTVWRKAFCSVPRHFIWWTFRRCGVEEWLVRLIQSMYENARSRVHVGCNLSEEFSVKVRVRQGSRLSPLLFVTVLVALIQKFCTRCNFYADDLGIIVGGTAREVDPLKD